MQLYKSKLLGFVEYRTPAIYHATDSVLEPLDKVQGKLLKVVGCTPREALLNWKLAPLETRRDIAMLGLIHRTALGKGPSHFKRFFRLKQHQPQAFWTRLAERRHDRQLESESLPNCPELLRRSALGLVQVYNLLPQKVVSSKCVRNFQKQLQELVVERAASDCEDWQHTLSPRVPWWRHALR